MYLPGAEIDEVHAKEWITRLVKGIWPLNVRNPSKTELFSRIEDKARGAGGCCLYFQGHGVFTALSSKRYITAQNGIHPDEPWDGLDPEDMMDLLSLTNHLPWRIVATDFCRSGNCFSLQFVLYVDDEKVEWRTARGWSGKQQPSPVIHFAGATEDEMVYEKDNLGGFFTKALSEHPGNLSLPGMLRAIRSQVNRLLEDAKKTAPGVAAADDTQTPQIFSSTKLSLEDTLVLLHFQRS
ncbi:ICE-like protease (caspase) p20 domain protein [Ceratobasidium sp. AG-Ba]|nr:ICE-like protease (caspase) p20 domain protein [Ceratobasidium sp. AG-Ba]